MDRFLSVALHVICASVVFALGLTCVILVAGAQDTMNQYADSGTIYPQESHNLKFYHEDLLFYIPGHWVTAGNSAIFAAGIFSALAGFFGFVLLCKHHFYMFVIGAFSAFASTCTALFALFYSMVSYYTHDNTWGYYDDHSTNGTYTVESWTCALKDELPRETKNFSRVCTESVCHGFLLRSR